MHPPLCTLEAPMELLLDSLYGLFMSTLWSPQTKVRSLSRTTLSPSPSLSWNAQASGEYLINQNYRNFLRISNNFVEKIRELLDISRKFLELSRKFLQNSKKFLDIYCKFQDIYRNVLDFARNFLDISGNFLDISGSVSSWQARPTWFSTFLNKKGPQKCWIFERF